MLRYPRGVVTCKPPKIFDISPQNSIITRFEEFTTRHVHRMFPQTMCGFVNTHHKAIRVLHCQMQCAFARAAARIQNNVALLGGSKPPLKLLKGKTAKIGKRSQILTLCVLHDQQFKIVVNTYLSAFDGAAWHDVLYHMKENTTKQKNFAKLTKKLFIIFEICEF